MIAAHGATVSVTDESVIVSPSPLQEALTGSPAGPTIALAEVSNVAVSEGDAWEGGFVSVDAGGVTTAIRFEPGDLEGPGHLAHLIDAARRGEAPSVETPAGRAGIPDFSFVAVEVDTANLAWESVCRISAAKVIDGEIVEHREWTCTPPPGKAEFDPVNVARHGVSQADVDGCPPAGECVAHLAEFAGDLPLVAHNAQFAASALCGACIASTSEVPTLRFACTLALARAATLDVKDHALPTLAAHFGVEGANPNDRVTLCAGVMVELARAARYEGDVMGFVHDAGFSLGVVEAGHVTPVLRDRSGASRALQARGESSPTPRGSNQTGTGAGDSSPRRGPAPWQSVATPEDIPEPNPQADPNSPLYGHNVTLTGEFGEHDKGELWSAIAQQGGQVGKNVTKKTTILVVGEWATITSKEKRARELIDKGQAIDIWPAEQLFAALGS
ncbi:DNA polymerase III subunit epsilon [Corynebacterium capitovis DSM 44611]|uniref:BRCT domain-containing protein n=1 Tax=Corynebacterium capitovis TaxID=131081 RepID=UPI00036C3C04|nr:BRCT domain-containing protein [Corynebacterium capitovis]WKD57397.1 DNA polymerase III subunit epsilon [Corynebacterium capitovis DSM 44611]